MMVWLPFMSITSVDFMLFSRALWVVLRTTHRQLEVVQYDMCYNTVNLLQNTHNRHPIARPRLLLVQYAIYVLLLFRYCHRTSTM